MKLVDLNATGIKPRQKYLNVGFSQATYDQLVQYRESREAAGFIRLATMVLLAVTGGDKIKIKCVADELTISCETHNDLIGLAESIYILALELERRMQETDEG